MAEIPSVAEIAGMDPFPVLTPQQRYFLDTHGFVVLENSLTTAETALLHGEVQRLKTDLVVVADALLLPGDSGGASDQARLRGAVLHGHTPGGGGSSSYSLMNLLQCGGAITGYAVYPKLVGAAAELLGGEPRIVEQNSIINRKVDPAEFKPGWHRGIDLPFASVSAGGAAAEPLRPTGH